MTEETVERFEKRSKELSKLSDEELKNRFWELCNQVVAPIVDLARTHTSPSIERSVLLRMGIDSITSHGVVDRILAAGLLGKGAGHVVLEVAKSHKLDIRSAAATILEKKEILNDLFTSGTEKI
jgi:D-ornithine 4,5-aminomutase subunit alpha